MAYTNIDKIDFEKEANKQLKEELKFVKESRAMQGGSQVPTQKDAIDSFY